MSSQPPPFDPNRAITRAAVEATHNGGITPQAPPLVLQLQNCQVDVIEATDDQSKARLKVVRVTHVSGGLIVDIPLPATNAKVIGNALCDRPNITLP